MPTAGIAIDSTVGEMEMYSVLLAYLLRSLNRIAMTSDILFMCSWVYELSQ